MLLEIRRAGRVLDVQYICKSADGYQSGHSIEGVEERAPACAQQQAQGMQQACSRNVSDSTEREIFDRRRCLTVS